MKTAAVAVVALAVWGMAGSLCPDRPRVAIAIAATVGVLAWPTGWGQLLVIALAGVIGWRYLKPDVGGTPAHSEFRVSRGAAVACLCAFAVLLVGLPLLQMSPITHGLSLYLQVFESFYRAGSLVFGGGHVVLPLLQELVVGPGWVTNGEFVAGYGAAQAVPGPLFTFSAYLGTVMAVPQGFTGGLYALAAIFLPSFFLVIGAMPFWDQLRSSSSFGGAIRGINAAVVGLLLAALYDPVWTSAIHGSEDFALALAALGVLAVWKWPPWVVVVLSALAGQGLVYLDLPL